MPNTRRFLFNDNGMTHLLDILEAYNYGEEEGHRTLESLMILVTDTFGGESLERHHPEN